MVKQAAEDLGFELMRMPPYGPDLNPIEGLWKWIRAEVTQLHDYTTMRELFVATESDDSYRKNQS